MVESSFSIWVFNSVNIFIGFVLGFLSAIILDLVRDCRKVRRFYIIATNELKQVLAMLNIYALHADSSINKEKVLLAFRSLREFELQEQVNLIPDEAIYQQLIEKLYSPSELDQFAEAWVTRHEYKKAERRQEKKQLALSKLKANFLLSNTDIFASLKAKDSSRILDILRRIDTLNDNIDKLQSFFNKSFDASLPEGAHQRIEANFYSQCQYVADGAHIAAKEVFDLLRRWKAEKRAE